MNLEIDELTSHFEVRDEAKIRKDVVAAVTDAIHDIADTTTDLADTATDPIDSTPTASDAPEAEAAPAVDDSPRETE